MAYDNNDKLEFDLILPGLKANNRKQILQILADETAKKIGIRERVIFDRLMDKERQASSGIGEGIAIPHLRVSSLIKPFILFASLSHAIEFNAVDDRPVDLFCLLLSPERDGPHHLRRLAEISRRLKDGSFCSQLREAESREQIRSLFTENKNRKLAA